MVERKKYSLLGDVPIEISLRKDALNFRNHAKVLGRAAVDTKEPITIGVFGEWGTGKTSLMKLIEKEVEEEDTAVSVWFNAWQYEKEEHLIVPLIATIRKQLDKKIDQKGGNEKWLEKFGKAMKGIRDALVTVAYGFSVKGKMGIPLVSEVEVNLSAQNMVRRYQDLTKDSILDRSLYFDSFETLLNSTKVEGGFVRIVVFVDDLDRCFPDKAVELIEGIKLVLNLPGFSFVLGMYEKIIRDFVRSKYSVKYNIESSYFNNYLDKIVQVKIKVPNRDAKGLRDYIRALMNEGGVFQKNVKDELILLIAETSRRNPRSVIRLLNRVMVTMRIGELETQQSEWYDPTALVLQIATEEDHWLDFKDNLDVRVNAQGGTGTVTLGELLAEYLEKDEDENRTLSSNIVFGLSHLKPPSLSPMFEQIEKKLFENKHVLAVLKTDSGLRWLRDGEFRMRHGVVGDQTIGETKVKKKHILHSPVTMFMISVPKAIYVMGDDSLEHALKHRVMLETFAIQETPVTEKQYGDIMKKVPATFNALNNPVINVSWFEAVAYCNELSKSEGRELVYDMKTGEADFAKDGYRLPTEAEWEYACRAGSETTYCFGDAQETLPEYAWFHLNSDDQIHPVKRKKPNPFGLYDMHGNVYEWCHDWYNKLYPVDADTDNPRGPQQGKHRVIRGGSWFHSAKCCGCAARKGSKPNERANFIGFRVVCPL